MNCMVFQYKTYHGILTEILNIEGAMGQYLCGVKIYMDLKNQGIISCWLKRFFLMGIWFCVLTIQIICLLKKN